MTQQLSALSLKQIPLVDFLMVLSQGGKKKREILLGNSSTLTIILTTTPTPSYEEGECGWRLSVFFLLESALLSFLVSAQGVAGPNSPKLIPILLI